MLRQQLAWHMKYVEPRTPESVDSVTNIIYNGILLRKWCSDELGPRHKLWQIMRDKLKEFAKNGLRCVAFLWPPEWGECPPINPTAWAYRVPIRNKTVRRTLRRWRKWLLRVLLRHGIPSDVRLHTVYISGL